MATLSTYRLSAAGRRTVLILLVCAMLIWGFALWTFRSTLGTSDDAQLSFLAALRQNIEQGLTISQLVPALLMLVLIVATPLVIWNMLEEWAASYTPTSDGLRFESLGISLLYPWDGVIALRRQDDDSDEPIDELLFKQDYTQQIRNPLLRFLHCQAYGKTRLPIYAGLEQRDALIATIRAAVGEAPTAVAQVPATEAGS